ncbi:hypothetical protein CsatB_006553 [Cannabis sativa]
MKLNIPIVLIFFSLFCVSVWFGIVSAVIPRCGTSASGALCPNNLCCSSYGFCGSTHKYCGVGCQSQCGPSPLSPERPDHRCGPDFGESPCGEGRCCSIYQYCGSTSEFCEGSHCRYQCLPPT